MSGHCHVAPERMVELRERDVDFVTVMAMCPAVALPIRAAIATTTR